MCIVRSFSFLFAIFFTLFNFTFYLRDKTGYIYVCIYLRDTVLLLLKLPLIFSLILLKYSSKTLLTKVSSLRLSVLLTSARALYHMTNTSASNAVSL